MDEIDLKIINMLLKDGRTSYADIAEEIQLSLPATRDRVLKLTKDGVIKGFTVQVNYEKIGLGIRALMFVELSANGADVKNQLANIPNILNCSALAGKEDLLLEIIVKSTKDLLILSEKIRSIDGVERTRSNILLHEYFSQTGIVNNLIANFKQTAVSGVD
jgi:Lrp/AsnC family leucine-responsive transcriptional regulator